VIFTDTVLFKKGTLIKRAGVRTPWTPPLDAPLLPHSDDYVSMELAFLPAKHDELHPSCPLDSFNQRNDRWALAAGVIIGKVCCAVSMNDKLAGVKTHLHASSAAACRFMVLFVVCPYRSAAVASRRPIHTAASARFRHVRRPT